MRTVSFKGFLKIDSGKPRYDCGKMTDVGMPGEDQLYFKPFFELLQES